MKLLQINSCYGFKSTGIIVNEIKDIATKNGFENFVAYQFFANSDENCYLIGNRLSWKFHALYTRIFGKQAYASKGATKKLLKWIDRIQPDIVHLHNLHSNYINLNMLSDYLSEKNIPTVITLHDCWFFTGKCTHFVSESCDGWKNQCGDCPNLKKEVPSWFFDRTSFVLRDKTRHLNSINNLTVVGCSKWISELVKESHLKPKRIITIPNGIDISIFTPRLSDFREVFCLENKFVVLGMADKWGLAENNNGVIEIIKSANEDTVFIILGCNEKEKKIFSRYKNVICFGYVADREKLAEIYSASDVFVNLTHADTLPTVNMESICCGTPVITFDVGGSPEIIDGDDGYIVNEWDFNQIILKINYMKEHKMIFNVDEKQKKFDKNYCFSKYVDLYKEILGERWDTI